MSDRKARLANVVSLRTGKLDSNAAVPDGEFPFFTCAQQTFRIDKAAFDTEAVLLGGNNAAGVFPLKYYDGQFNAYQRTYVIETLDPEVLSIRFLYYALQSALVHFQSASIGAATQYLTKGILDNFEITVPPVLQQRLIVDILSVYDDLIENNRQRIALLEQAARELYREWFVRLRFPGHEHTKIVDGVPEGWGKKVLGDIGQLKYGKALKAEDRIEGEYPVYGSSGIVGTHEEAHVPGPGIIVGRKGNVGRVYWSDGDFCAIDTVYFFEPSAVTLYIYYALQNVDFINTDVAVPGLNRNFAHSRKCLVPSGQLRDAFDDVAKPLHNQISLLRKENESLVRARDLLLPRLMSGEVAV